MYTTRKRKKPTTHKPLSVDIESDLRAGVKTKRTSDKHDSHHGSTQAHSSDDEVIERQDRFLSQSISEKLLHNVRRQQEEVEAENQQEDLDTQPTIHPTSTNQEYLLEGPSEEDDGVDDATIIKDINVHDELDDMEYRSYEDTPNDFEDVDLEQLALQVNDQDQLALSFFQQSCMEQSPKTASFDGDPKSLGELIMQKLIEHERKKTIDTSGGDDQNVQKNKHLSKRILKTYHLIGVLLQSYTSGPLPRAFKVIPTLSNWSEILSITRPDEWSYPAVYEATRIFVSSLGRNVVHHFYQMVLYPHIRKNILEKKKLNGNLYMALKKSLFKPEAFYRGILFPLCQSQHCSIREAMIIGSLLKKMSIPAAHSCVAIYKIAQMPDSPANSLFLGILLNKKYALPYEIIDVVVNHFLQAINESELKTVIWHQSLLVFVQRYKNDITVEMKQQMKVLLKNQNHQMITPDIRLELFSTKSRDEISSTSTAMDIAPTIPPVSIKTQGKAIRKKKIQHKPSFDTFEQEDAMIH